jgi:DNA-binding transcriptional regulator YiaG
MTIAEEVRAIRAALQENTATFGARWRRSGRTIEDWEQGRREPDAFVLEAIRALAARRRKKRKGLKRASTSADRLDIP